MINKCKICGEKTIVFLWSTSRNIDKEKLKELSQFQEVPNLDRIAYPICWACIGEHNLIISTKEDENDAKRVREIIQRNSRSK